MKTIYLAIWHDRHYDDEFKAFYTIGKAIHQCHEWIETYDGRYDFEPNDIYEYYLSAMDGSYHVRVEKVELYEN